MPSEPVQAPCCRGPVETLLSISKSFRALYGMKLSPTGLFNGQDELLMALDEIGKTTGRVAEELSIRPSTVSKMTDRLIERGLVVRVSDRTDGRRAILRISPSGEALRRAVVSAREEMNAEFLTWSQRTGADLNELQAVADLLSKKLKRLR